jgi:hypothetical protein
MQPVGLLISQIGYDLEASMRGLYRGPLPDGATFRLQDAISRETVLHKPLVYWGNCWQSDWWIADFSELDHTGEFTLTVEAEGFAPVTCPPFKVADYLLWDATIRDVAIGQFERRAEESRFGKGWRDCGAEWREAGSHSGALIGLLDLLYLGHRWLGKEDTLRLTKQIIHGCNFLVECQQRASDLGYPTGALVHEIPNSTALIPQDQGQAAVALAKAARYIYEYDAALSMDYLNRAAQAYEYFTRQCRPSTLPNFSAQLHGAPDGYVPTTFMTGDLMMMVWGGVELAHSGRSEYLDEAVYRAREVLRRQVSQDEPEGEFYGHFYTFADRLFTEKAFIHHHVGHDTSVMFNHYIVPLMDLCQRLPEHREAPRWRQAIHDFAYGYFLPACRKNPFFLLPQGYYAGQGLLTFGGPWHGFNVIYGYAAALAVQFEYFFNDHQFREIAVGNLQWMAGLNSGMTADSFEGSLMWQERIPEGEAIPYSMMHGIGRNAIKTWSQITGSIGNGYCTNRQFHMELEPTVEHDIPLRYSDEDWIPHAGGWASGLAYFHHIMTWTR